jgi:hypothetical protein
MRRQSSLPSAISNQKEKVKEGFEKVQTGILLTSFRENSFQSLVAIPLVKFQKIQNFGLAEFG